MDIKLLKTDILSNNIPKFLIFESDEQALSKQYIEYISSTIGREYKFYTSADAAIYDITTNIKEDYLYVIYNDKSVKEKDAYVDTLKTLDRNIIVYFEEIKKDNFYNKYIQNIVLFHKIDKYTLIAYAKKLCKDNKCKIDVQKIEEIVDKCDCNLGILLNELNKIFTLNQDSSANILVDYMLKSDFTDYRNVNIYDVIGRVLKRDKSAIPLLYKLQEPPMGIIICMYNIARSRLLKNKNSYYGSILKECFNMYSYIVEGKIDEKVALKHLVFKVYGV